MTTVLRDVNKASRIVNYVSRSSTSIRNIFNSLLLSEHLLNTKLLNIYLMRLVLRSSTIIKYIFNSFVFSKCSLNKKLLNIYLIEVDERDISERHNHRVHLKSLRLMRIQGVPERSIREECIILSTTEGVQPNFFVVIVS